MTNMPADPDINQLVGKVLEVRIEDIQPDPENLRDSFDEEDLLDLGRNIQQVGQLDDITVFPVTDGDGKWTGKFDLHDGERRWRAAQLVGITSLNARVVSRPSWEELLFKKMSRLLQTRTLAPERKVVALEHGLRSLGVLENPSEWENYRQRLGGGTEWPQLVRVLHLRPAVRNLMNEGTINFTLAQSIGRLPPDRQEEAARYVVTQKINGRYFGTQMVPYLLEHPEASLAEAFEHTKVGDWQAYLKSPYERGHEPPLEERLEDFLEACVKWERAWEVLVHTNLVHAVSREVGYKFRLKDAARRIQERVSALYGRLDSESGSAGKHEATLPTLVEGHQQALE